MALTALTGLVRQGKFLLNENSRTILTGVGVVGTIGTAYMTGRATFKAAWIIDQEQKKRTELVEDASVKRAAGHKPEDITNLALKPELTRFEKIRKVWHFYIPPAGLCVTTVTCIIAANKIASKKIAALALASGISERALQEYKAKVVEKLGERQDTKIRDEIAQDRVNRNPVGSREVILAGTGEVLCYDLTSGRYFQSTVEEIKRAENNINHTLNNFMSASLTEFYSELGLTATTHSDSVGWNANNHVEVTFSATLSTDDRPCMAIDFVTPPFTEYNQLHD